jgi:pyridoxine 4-dehydrogenase
VPIPGTASVEHLEENIVAAVLELSQAAFETLSAVQPAYVSLRD